MDDDVGAVDEPAHGVGVANVAAELLDGTLELGVVERRHVERANGVAVCEQPPREVQAEETRAAGDRVQHRTYASWPTGPTLRPATR